MGYKVAVVGATGNVGREMLNVLNERRFPAKEVIALASRRSIGTEVSYGDTTLKCRDLESFDFRGVDFCLMSAGSSVSKEWAPKIGQQGCIVIDNSSYWRYDQDVPLIVPEVNPDDRGLSQEEHHRQPELLNSTDGCGLEADSRCSHHQARGCLHLPIGLGGRQGGDGRALATNQGQVRAGHGSGA